MAEWQLIETAGRVKIQSRIVLIGWQGTDLVIPALWTTHPDYENGRVPSWVGMDSRPGYTPTHYRDMPEPPK